MKKIVLIFISIFLLSSCLKEEVEIVSSEVKQEKIIIALGDSLTAGYNLKLEDSYPMQLEGVLSDNEYKYKVINAGVSGDTSKNLLDRIGLYDGIKANIYIISIGGNDGLRRQDLSKMKENINNVINKIKSKNKESQIVLAGMQIPINLGLKYSNDFKNSFGIIAEENDIYLYDFLLEDVAKVENLNLSDGIHPNKEGYEIMSKNIFNYLEQNNLITK